MDVQVGETFKVPSSCPAVTVDGYVDPSGNHAPLNTFLRFVMNLHSLWGSHSLLGINLHIFTGGRNTCQLPYPFLKFSKVL